MLKTRLGIVGCGRVAAECHIPAALSASNAELVAVADSTEDRLADILSTFSLSCLATTSYIDLIGNVDAVLLLLPNHLHYSVGSEFLAEGVHVLCEKPLATTTRDGRLLCELAEAKGLVLAVGYMKRFESNCDLMKRLLDQQFLGRLDRFDFEYGSTGHWSPVSGYNLQRQQAGGGVLMINGCHVLDRMLYWFGCPSSVEFSDDSHGGVEANCLAAFAFGSGLIGEVRLSRTQSLRNRFRLYGERGYIEIHESQHGSLSFVPSDGSGLRHEISADIGPKSGTNSDCFRLQIEDFAQAIQSGTQPRVTGRQGLASVHLIERCYQTRTALSESWVSDSLPRRSSACWEPPRGTPTQRSEEQRDDARLLTRDTPVSLTSDDPLAIDPPAVHRALTSGPVERHRHPQGKRCVLVTGSTGFVGSRLCEVVHCTTDYQLRPFIHSTGRASYIARYPLHFTTGDLTDLSTVRRAIEGCSSVVHLARGSDRVMIDGLKNVLRAAVEAKVTRFIHVSSVAIYGSDPPAAARYETAPARKTMSAYGNIKLEQEKLVSSYGRRFGLPFVILRPPHIFGPYSHFVADLTQRLKANALPLVDGGVNVCNLVYIDNLVEGILLSLESEHAVGETFFITDKERVTWKECLEQFAAMLGVAVPCATSDQLKYRRAPGSRESLRRISQVLLSREFRAALMGFPPIGAVGAALYDRYERLPAKQRRYVQSWLNPPVVTHHMKTTMPRYDGTDHLIAAQRRTVVHACDKAERLLGYTAAIRHIQAMRMTREWLQFARVIC
jgi:predicted dehydrogenase/nucleoside-diphosphate-sugar epimerase